MVKSAGAVDAFSELFEGRRMEKTYLAVVTGGPKQMEWTCELKLAPDKQRFHKMKVDPRHGKDATTHFKILRRRGEFSLVEARPVTGRTHQIRVHLAESGLPVVSDELYGTLRGNLPLGLRAVRMGYTDPYTKKRVEIHAPVENFLRQYGF